MAGSECVQLSDNWKHMSSHIYFNTVAQNYFNSYGERKPKLWQNLFKNKKLMTVMMIFGK